MGREPRFLLSLLERQQRDPPWGGPSSSWGLQAGSPTPSVQPLPAFGAQQGSSLPPFQQKLLWETHTTSQVSFQNPTPSCGSPATSGPEGELNKLPRSLQAPLQCPTVLQAGLCSVMDAHTLQSCETEIRDVSGNWVSVFGTGEDAVRDSGEHRGLHQQNLSEQPSPCARACPDSTPGRYHNIAARTGSCLPVQDLQNLLVRRREKVREHPHVFCSPAAVPRECMKMQQQ